jgi:hypothetical protein
MYGMNLLKGKILDLAAQKHHLGAKVPVWATILQDNKEQSLNHN